MNNEDLIIAHEKLCKLIHDTYCQKNKAYGNSFDQSLEKYGLIAALTRESDKWSRIENLILHPDTDKGDEPLIDSLLDLANYCLMTVMFLERKQEKRKVNTLNINELMAKGQNVYWCPDE